MIRKSLLAAGLLLLVVALAAGGRWLWIGVHVGAGFAAKVICSLTLNSGQDPVSMMRDYVAHEVAPLGPLLDVSTSPNGAETRVLGFVGARAVYRPGLGCTLLPGSNEADLKLPQGLTEARRKLDPKLPWPEGEGPPTGPAPAGVAEAIDRAFRELEPREPGRIRQTKAVLVAQDGRLVAERYAPGYGPETPMLSWSMAKSVLAALVGVAVSDGKLVLDAPASVPEWSASGDRRADITLDELLRMSSGLDFDEHYGAVNDVSRMLFTMPDVGAFAARSPLKAPPDTLWAYSSGTSNIIARILRDAFDGDLAALVRYANERLFDPAGMTSAFFETDVSGTPIGSSFVFMTARDWARFGELHRRDGVWAGQRILPEGWVKYVTTPTPTAPRKEYGAHWWLNAGASRDRSRHLWPAVPTDVYSARGHSGQYVVVVPSARLVVVRLGLALPDDGNDGTAELVADLIQVLG